MINSGDRDAILLPGRPGETLTAADAVLTRFTAKWRRGERPSIDAALAESPSSGVALLTKLIKIDMAELARAGERVRLEDYIGRFADIPAHHAVPVDLIVEEYCVRVRQHESPDLSEYAERFPDQFEALRATLGATDRPLANAQPEPRAEPDVSSIGEFELVRPLGAGAQSIVYLARQRSLDRLVALKISPNIGQEGRTLASLEHDHIVLVYSEQIVGDKRLLAMRYVPGITLARLLELLDGRDRSRCSGRDLLSWIGQEVAGASGPAANEPVARIDVPATLAKLNFVRASCAILLGLARAIEHAHGRGVLHRDVKPANVLIDRDGRALLMDFNIAAPSASQPRTSPGEVSRESERGSARGLAHENDNPFGGTLAYMAPEHLAAFSADAPQQPAAVDERSDVFSLGVVFYELLTGRHPFRVADSDSGPATVRQMLADRLHGPAPISSSFSWVTPGLQCVLEKCLAPNPGDRYQSAHELAEDLDRYLSYRPLRHAADPSWTERGVKWVRRHPRVVTAAVTLLATMCLAIVVQGWREYRRLDQIQVFYVQALRDFTSFESTRRTKATQMLRAAQRLADQNYLVLPLLGFGGRIDEVARSVSAGPGRLTATLRRQFEQRAAYDLVLSCAPHTAIHHADALALYDVIERPNWRDQPFFQLLSSEEQSIVDEEVTEMLLVRALKHLGPGRDSQAVDPSPQLDVHQLIERVPPQHRRRFAIQELLRRAGAAMDPTHPPSDLPAAPPESEWDRFDLHLMGVLEAAAGQWESAVRLFSAAIERAAAADEPPSYWSHFHRAVCCEQLGRTEEAIADYGVCIGLWDGMAWAHHNLGRLHASQGKYDLALLYLREATRRAPWLLSAHINLAAAALKVERFDEALRAANDALDLDDRSVEALVNRAAAYAATGSIEQARRDLMRVVELDPHCTAAMENLRLLDTSERPPTLPASTPSVQPD